MRYFTAIFGHSPSPLKAFDSTENAHSQYAGMSQSSRTLPPNSCLIAVLLVIRTRAGPRLVFHYPASPSAASGSSGLDPAWYGTPGSNTANSDNSSSEWSSDDGDTTGDEDGTNGSRTGSRHDTSGSVKSFRIRRTPAGVREEIGEEFLDRSRDKDARSRTSARDSHDERNGSVEGEPEWEELLGFGADGLSKMLTPERNFNKKRFELGIDRLVFLGAPRFVRDDGLWKKRRRPRRKSIGEETEGEDKLNNAPEEQVNSADEEAKEQSEQPNRELEEVPVYDAAYGHGLMSGAASRAVSDVGSDSTTNGTGSDMTMFNVVFVLNPPELEYGTRVEDMYDNVARKFAKALKYEQAQTGFVYNESRLILTMKDKAKEQQAPIYTLWPTILKSSTLAKSIAITFDAISHNKIAHVNFGMDFDISFQIPQTIATATIATPYDPQMPGLWLTTATMLDDDEDPILSPHSALLLLEDGDALLKEVESDAKELSGPLAFLIRHLTPTKSLLKLSQMHSMSLKDLQFLARHLIYWRRARAIPPLRPRDTYIVSPNADLRELNRAITAFAARFPMLPPLPKILYHLSGNPRPYGTLIPSKDHRQAYMEILAWLMRGGWVTQLGSFGWVRVSPAVKVAVAAKMAREEKAKKKSHRPSTDSNGAKTELSDDEEMSNSTILSPPAHRSIDSRASVASEASITSPRLSAHLTPSKPPSEAGSASSGRTTVPIGTLSPLLQSNAAMLKKPSPLHLAQTASQSQGENHSSPTNSHALSWSGELPSERSEPSPFLNPKDYTASLILSTQRANDLEARWIEHIGESFEDAELKELWPIVLKYFDGRHALEGIAVREGLKKKRVAKALAGMTAGGWVVCVRHW